MALPPRGSVQDIVLREMVERERYEEYVKYDFLGQLIAAGLKLNNDAVNRLREGLRLAIFQTAYNPEQVEIRLEETRRRLRAEQDARLQDARLMESVARMGEDEEAEKADAFPVTLGKNRLHGISDPWSK